MVSSLRGAVLIFMGFFEVKGFVFLFRVLEVSMVSDQGRLCWCLGSCRCLVFSFSGVRPNGDEANLVFVFQRGICRDQILGERAL